MVAHPTGPRPAIDRGSRTRTMSLDDSIARREAAIINKLQEKQSAIDDRTGKGLSTEMIMEHELLKPFLPPRFACGKGAVVTSKAPDKQSSAIDRVIYDTAAATPLIHDEAHSVFPIEGVCGLVEITMHLDARKLKSDIEKMAQVKAMIPRRYLVPVPTTTTKMMTYEDKNISPTRSFVIGLPALPGWKPATIANTLRKIQVGLGPPTHVHGLYVLGIGFFETIPIEPGEPMYRIRGWTGKDRLFRFADSFRKAFDRWNPLPQGWMVDVGQYVKGHSQITALGKKRKRKGVK